MLLTAIRDFIYELNKVLQIYTHYAANVKRRYYLERCVSIKVQYSVYKQGHD
jgi:hypothetical protein